MTWTINSVDPRATYGLVIAQITGWQDFVQEQLPTIAVPGVPGVVALSTVPVVQPRRLVASGVIKGIGSTLAIRATDARTRFHALRAMLAKSVTIEIYDRPGQFIIGQCESINVPPVPASMITDTLAVTISIVCRDPYFYDGTPTSQGLGGSMVLGTAPTRPVITTTMPSGGSQSLDVITYPGGVSMGHITVGPLLTGDVLIVDMAARTTKVNGVLRPDLITEGDYWAFDIATQGDYATSAWPLAIGGAAGTAVYRKAWR